MTPLASASTIEQESKWVIQYSRGSTVYSGVIVFAAGICAKASPSVAFMHNKSRSWISDWCRRHNWTVKDVTKKNEPIIIHSDCPF